jgi:hypothetical protein
MLEKHTHTRRLKKLKLLPSIVSNCRLLEKMPKDVQSKYIQVTLITCGVCIPENHGMYLKLMEQEIHWIQWRSCRKQHIWVKMMGSVWKPCAWLDGHVCCWQGTDVPHDSKIRPQTCDTTDDLSTCNERHLRCTQHVMIRTSDAMPTWHWEHC